jgi:hypothetical protein
MVLPLAQVKQGKKGQNEKLKILGRKLIALHSKQIAPLRFASA